MSISLQSYISTPVDGVGFIQSSESSGQQAERLKLSKLRLDKAIDAQEKSTAKYFAVAAIVGLHIGITYLYVNRDQTPSVPIKKHEVSIEFIKPEIEPPPPPPPPPEPPKPPPPKVQKAPPPPALRTPVATQDVAPNDIVVQENTEAPITPGPVVAAEEPTPPAPPAPVVEEPVTEASANAGYLNNPKPIYPPAAARQGWGGTVVLRVRVLANGSVESVTVKKSSGKKVLDEAASGTVKTWTFVPSKRGSTPIDGWATVPIVFNPEQ